MSEWQWNVGTNPTTNGEYLVVDRIWRGMSVAQYMPESRPSMGWCINGRWLGHDAVECLDYLPDLPERPKHD